MPRFTKKVLQMLLGQDECFERTTHYKGKNFEESRQYTISGGELHYRSTGKTSWAHSRFDETYTADKNQTRNFFKKFFNVLKSDGVE